MELTSNIRKMVASLAAAKHRREHGLFVAEGTKCVLETVGAFDVYALFATQAWIDAHRHEVPADVEPVTVKRDDIVRMSSLSTPSDVMAVYRIPVRELDTERLRGRLVIALDRVQDPGNLGTILRIADWFGVTDVLCSSDTVDLYNPKTVQSTMGAIARVSVHYVDLPATLRSMPEMPVYGTFLDGRDIYASQLTAHGVIVMGNEGSGISDAVAAAVTDRLYIPSYPAGRPTVESLNVSMATAVTVAEFRRRTVPSTSKI